MGEIWGLGLSGFQGQAQPQGGEAVVCVASNQSTQRLLQPEHLIIDLQRGPTQGPKPAEASGNIPIDLNGRWVKSMEQ